MTLNDERVIAQALTHVGRPGRIWLTGLPNGLEFQFLPELAQAAGKGGLVYVCLEDRHLAQAAEQLEFYAPELKVLSLPAWDCLPYDRVSPSNDITSRRMNTLTQLCESQNDPFVVLTTVNAIMQRLVPVSAVTEAILRIKPGQSLNDSKLLKFFGDNGYSRAGTVVEPGDFAVRGGLVDVFPPSLEMPVRLDFFGSTLESIRLFDPQSQRTTEQMRELNLMPASEVVLNARTIANFRRGYAAAFGGIDTSDPLYESVTSARRFQGMEHWLPLFYDTTATLFDYLPDASMVLAHSADEAISARQEQVVEFYEARRDAIGKSSFGASPYKPLPVDSMFLTGAAWTEAVSPHAQLLVSQFERPESSAISFGGKKGRTFAAERIDSGVNVYDAVREHVQDLWRSGKQVAIACWTEGSKDRLVSILEDHKLEPVVHANTWKGLSERPSNSLATVFLPLEDGFETDTLAVISEQDILGDRLVRRTRKTKKASDFFSELSSLSPGDILVHVDHGVGRFEGLRTLEVQSAPHDCLLLTYANNDRLFIPVENIELLSRYGADNENVQLDRLGGGAWQAKKAKLKQRIREIAGDLIKTAAARELKAGEILAPPEGAYDEFCARFPYEETEDQLTAIEATLEDMQSGRPMDRLVCGDVGFGKTEVALRAAFVAAFAGKQVAIVVPTTLLCRQHFKTFSERFRGLPLRVAQASRLVGAKELDGVKQGIAAGEIDIVVGTHALLAASTKFRDLGLLIIDEEQHFGVKHKERLKELRQDVHVLTLTATPIPRTLQLALSGLREMSLITTPPVDRLAVRTFISPFDPVTIREHLLREHFRGGQSFYVVPRISDLDEISAFLRESVPELKFRVAHGRLPPTVLEDIMTGFYDRAFDVLVSTTIVESGLDVPTANTLIVHRADIFGLAQLYQLRGRVGRSKQRAYALLTTPPNRQLTSSSERRLKVLQSLDTLGAGFTLASHDLDIRGAGNLLGEEQHGNIREVGYELYQSMLEEEVATMRGTLTAESENSTWSPQINIGTSVLIPESYVADLQVRLGLYRRLADFTDQAEIDAYGAELHDRFGKPPVEVQHLLDIVSIKVLCKTANVQSVDAGPKGATIDFRNGVFPQPAKLVSWIGDQGTTAKIAS